MTHMKKREGRIGKNYEKYYRSDREKLYNTKFWTILTHFIGLSQSFAVSGYLFLSLAILGYIWLSRAIFRYLWLSQYVSGQWRMRVSVLSRSRDWRYRDIGFVSVSYKISELVSSRSRLGWKFFRQSRLGLVSFASILLRLVSVSSWPGCEVFKEMKPKS